jgi:hypothetical protein
MSKVIAKRSPPGTSPESNVSSSAVTVWRRSLMFVHSTVSPGSTSSCVGENAWNWMSTGTAAEDAAADASPATATRPEASAALTVV